MCDYEAPKHSLQEKNTLKVRIEGWSQPWDIDSGLFHESIAFLNDTIKTTVHVLCKKRYAASASQVGMDKQAQLQLCQKSCLLKDTKFLIAKEPSQ
eukprot:c38453_g1_i1 orf=176-463(-)